MIFESLYEQLIGASQDITRRRDRLAKPAIRSLLCSRVDETTPNGPLIAHIIAEVLLRRIDRNLVESQNIYLQRFDFSQIDLFYQMCQGYPQVPQGHTLANQFLADAMRGVPRATVLDIGLGKGVQVGALLELVAADPGRLREVDVVALDPSEDNLAQSREWINAVGERVGLPVRVHPVHKLLEQCTPEDFRAIGELAGDGLVANSAFAFHHTVHPPGDTELRTTLLRRLAALRPRVLTLVEPNANHDTEQLTRRLDACWEHFGTVFDLVDEADIDPRHRFLIKETFFGREIRDIFGTSDAFRCERHELLESWLLRLTKAGFRPYPAVPVEVRLPSYCTVSVNEGLVRLGYRDLPLIAVLAYEARGHAPGD